ncbi:ABC transporter permease subunit [Eubacteriaceae bacterium ES3]|nr:ABC transporter permease subunit [Eubacteriaceae bacterium ES3]
MKISTHWANKRIVKLGMVLFWILLWMLAAWRVDNPLVLPSPFDTIKGVITLSKSPDFFVSIVTTLIRVFSGVLISFLIGLILGIIGGLKPLFNEFLNPLVVTIKSVPVVSIIILINLWIESSLVPLLVTFLICFPITWTNIIQGIKATDTKLLEMAAIYRVSAIKILRNIYLPTLRPYASSALINAIGLGWKVTVTAEVLANAIPSVGMNLYYARIYLETDYLFSWTLVIVVLSYLIEKLTVKGLNRAGKGVLS